MMAPAAAPATAAATKERRPRTRQPRRSPGGDAPVMPSSPPPPQPPPPAFAPDDIRIYRTIDLGSAQPEAKLVVATLSRDRTHARLVIETRTAPFTGREAADLPWQTAEVHHYDGDVAVDTAQRFELHLADSATHMPFPFACARATRHVAPATAIRVRDKAFRAACGDPGTWSAAANVRRDVLACGSPDHPDDYALAPGVETVGIAEQCYLQGRADRVIGADGAIAPTGSPHH